MDCVRGNGGDVERWEEVMGGVGMGSEWGWNGVGMGSEWGRNGVEIICSENMINKMRVKYFKYRHCIRLCGKN